MPMYHMGRIIELNYLELPLINHYYKHVLGLSNPRYLEHFSFPLGLGSSR
jgi:hypothetical protein